MPRHAVLLLLATFGLAACTSGSGSAATPPPSTSVVTSTAPAPTTMPTPLPAGPTTVVATAACPFATQASVRSTIGLRLGRVTVLRSGGAVVGCRFYAFQGGPLHASEHLPGPNQPAVEITTARYASVLEAHNAFVLRAGASSVRTDFDSTTGLCFVTAFDPQDKGNDWACTVNQGPVVVLVRSVDTAHNDGTAAIVRDVLRDL